MFCFQPGFRPAAESKFCIPRVVRQERPFCLMFLSRFLPCTNSSRSPFWLMFFCRFHVKNARFGSCSFVGFFLVRIRQERPFWLMFLCRFLPCTNRQERPFWLMFLCRFLPCTNSSRTPVLAYVPLSVSSLSRTPVLAHVPLSVSSLYEFVKNARVGSCSFVGFFLARTTLSNKNLDSRGGTHRTVRDNAGEALAKLQ